MTRGNQRELARAKNLKKQQDQAKKKTSGDKGSNKGQGLEARKQRDADVMRQKQLKAEAKKADSASGGK
ncbi:small EDRK-rich factor 2-like [Branchiostoma floridae x Branchiostoma belcheri]